jgi:hypothetical protein
VIAGRLSEKVCVVTGTGVSMGLVTAVRLIALLVGLSIPVIGAGVALDQSATLPDTVLGFAIVVGFGVAGAGVLLGQALKSAERGAGASSIKAPHTSI